MRFLSVRFHKGQTSEERRQACHAIRSYYSNVDCIGTKNALMAPACIEKGHIFYEND